jgi:hypothetical protein
MRLTIGTRLPSPFVGQPVAVTEKVSMKPGVVRFETNRNFTGMGHRRFPSRDDAAGDGVPERIAQRLFDSGKVASVHVYQNVVTAELRAGFDTGGLAELIETLYTYYVPGFVPPPLVMPAEEAAAPAAAPSGDGEGAPLSAAASLVPAHLLERSAKGKATWYAKYPKS